MITFSDQIIYENTLTDFFEKKKDQIISFFKKKQQKFPEKIKEIEKKLIKYHIDIAKIKEDAKTAAANSKIKNNKLTNFKSSINNFVNDFIYKRKYITNSDDTSLTKSVLISLVILAVVIFINSLLFKCFITLCGGKVFIAFALLSIFVAPIVEETGKMISVQQNATGAYFIIFNVVEFLLYFQMITSAGFSPLFAITTRIIPILIHLINTFIHYEAKQKNTVKEGMIITVLIHAVWNTFCSIGLLS